MTLEDLGWNEALEEAFAPCRARGWRPARLIRDNRITFGALSVENRELVEDEVILCGRLYHDAETDAELPAVGDWVALDHGGKGVDTVIRARLPRRTCFSRKAPGDTAEEQVMAANVDVVVVVTDAGPDFNPRRMERYFTLIGRSGARAVVLVNKSDLYTAEENAAAVEGIRALQDGVEVYSVSVKKRKGLKEFKALARRGVTLTLTGSSGVGKSALANLLLGEEWQWTGEVNEVTGKGRHTTAARELLMLPRGGILIDNPGIREVQMWTDETTLRERFMDIEELAQQCRFHDCRHGSDAGCAIRAAVEGGTLEAGRYQGFLRLDSEIEELRRRRKKRQMTVERISRRDHKIKARNPEDRAELQRELKPRA